MIGRVAIRVMWMGVLAASMLLMWACGSPGNPATPGTAPTNAPAGQVRGLILEVVEGEDDQLTGLRLRDESGKTWAFIADGNVGFSASHTRLHQVLGQTLLVSFETGEGRLSIVELTD